ncbi:MAG: sugar-transfer associated ATP-grasp domain-containing protein [Oscillospiraceae bacterium]
MKPNAGTHGDGFYKLEYTDGVFFVNEKESSADRIKELISSQKSSYVITEYIEMHRDLKKIYPGSVNTIRIMVINKTCFEPKIVQTYMRIGSSKTGVTDNIAYGGLAAYVDKDSGYYDRAALLSDHRYISMDHHPDTGTFLEGHLPNWETVKKGVYDISMMIPQLEYLGFDIAITEDGFKILEINIHQDIHKAHEFTEEINRFFSEKIQYKKELFNITK